MYTTYWYELAGNLYYCFKLYVKMPRPRGAQFSMLYGRRTVFSQDYNCLPVK